MNTWTLIAIVVNLVSGEPTAIEVTRHLQSSAACAQRMAARKQEGPPADHQLYLVCIPVKENSL